MATIISIAETRHVDAAWEAYRIHRAKEERDPTLIDDEAHVAESARLHAIFTDLYIGEPKGVVIPFRRKG